MGPGKEHGMPIGICSGRRGNGARLSTSHPTLAKLSPALAGLNSDMAAMLATPSINWGCASVSNLMLRSRCYLVPVLVPAWPCSRRALADLPHHPACILGRGLAAKPRPLAHGARKVLSVSTPTAPRPTGVTAYQCNRLPWAGRYAALYRHQRNIPLQPRRGVSGDQSLKDKAFDFNFDFFAGRLTGCRSSRLGFRDLAGYRSNFPVNCSRQTNRFL